MNPLLRLAYYADFRRHAVSRQFIHSPFVYDLVTVLQKKQDGETTVIKQIEDLRARLHNDRTVIRTLDLGAGGAGQSFREQQVCRIARAAAIPPRWGRELFRLAHHLRPSVMLELGTSLGIGTLYQAMANPAGKMITVEGCPETAAVARSNFTALHCANIVQVTGGFDTVLPGVVSGLNRIDYAYFDGNHRKEPTLRYFLTCLEKAHEGTVFVFDDIHWSAEMREAWKEICLHPRVSLSLDMFRMGVVFFSKRMEKQLMRVLV